MVKVVPKISFVRPAFARSPWFERQKKYEKCPLSKSGSHANGSVRF